MKKKIQSYFVLTTAGYRIIIFLLIPLVLLLSTFILERMQNSYIGVLVILAGYCNFEILADIGPFGGLLSKEIGLPEYCCTSKRGMWLITNALTTNMLRQMITEIVLVLAAWIGYSITAERMIWNENDWILVIGEILLTFIVIQLGSMIARFFGGLYIQLIIAMLATLMLVLATILVQIGQAPMLVLLCILLGMICKGSIAFVKKRGELSYYDERP